MSVVHVQAEDAIARLELSRDRLRSAAPELSAARLIGKRQWVLAGAVALVLLTCLVLWPMTTLQVLVAVCTFAYFATVAHRLVVTVLSRRAGAVVTVTDEEALAVPEADLPVYTVLVPAYREPEVIDALMDHLGAIDYPASRLDLKLLLEEDDVETVDRALRHPLADSVEIVLVPPGEPRTKPKALNYGLTLARGDLVTIYDAEDEPDTLQLRRAAVAFSQAPEDLACMQAQLTYRNPDQNLITRWFTVEYLMWFTLFLPGLAITDAPIPLGGTSNHIRRSALEGMGGWDPYNVTEDADLGVRLHRVGWRCGVLGSVTYEEANSDFVNWMKQRSRWYKGYLQTWLVHLRHPVRLWRELGGLGFLQFNLFVGGTPILALLNPIFWTLTILWFLGRFPFIQDLFPAPVYYAGLSCWAVGNLAVLYLTVLAARKAERPSLVLAALLVPLYWVMMSMKRDQGGGAARLPAVVLGEDHPRPGRQRRHGGHRCRPERGERRDGHRRRARARQHGGRRWRPGARGGSGPVRHDVRAARVGRPGPALDRHGAHRPRRLAVGRHGRRRQGGRRRAQRPGDRSGDGRRGRAALGHTGRPDHLDRRGPRCHRAPGHVDGGAGQGRGPQRQLVAARRRGPGRADGPPSPVGWPAAWHLWAVEGRRDRGGHALGQGDLPGHVGRIVGPRGRRPGPEHAPPPDDRDRGQRG
ncbi:MAG: glycosyltransferase family 2 protein [Acidimicrobiales bacterium]